MSIAVFLELIWALAAIGLVVLSGHTEIRWLAFFALVGGVTLATRALLSRLVHLTRSPVIPPEYTHPKLAVSVGGLVSVAVFLPVVQSRFWQIALLLWLIGAVVQGAKMALLTLLSGFARQGLRVDFRAGRPPRLRLPHVLIAGDGPFSKRTLVPWLLQLSETLWSTRQQTSDSAAPVLAGGESTKGWTGAAKAISVLVAVERHRWLGKRSLAAFVTLEDIDRFGSAEKHYIIDHAVGTVAICTRGGLWRALCGITLEEEENTRLLVKEVVQRSTLLRTLATVGKREIPTAEGDRRLHGFLHHTVGPVALLVPEMPVQAVDSVDDEDRHRLRGYELVSAPMRNVSRATPQVINLLANIALPLARSDRRLDPESRETVARLGADGLAPLADAYLRFRLSASAVERVLCLFDCFEVLIKYSVFALDAPGNGALVGALARPSLGIWTKVLREYINGKVPLEGDLARAIAEFWKQPLAGTPRELIDAVNGTGLSWPDSVPRSHLGWLNWLVWLRNTTKGHGGLEEKTCLPIWHGFHEALLDTVRQLSPLALESAIWSEDVTGKPVALQGWLRGPFRSSTLDLDPESLAPHNDRPELIHGGVRIALEPFVRCEGNSCLTWNSGDLGRAEYIDYATGRLQKLSMTIGTPTVRE